MPQSSDHRPATLIPGGDVFPHRHLTGIEGLQPHEIMFLLDEAERWIAPNAEHAPPDKRLAGLTQINAFFENSPPHSSPPVLTSPDLPMGVGGTHAVVVVASLPPGTLAGHE